MLNLVNVRKKVNKRIILDDTNISFERKGLYIIKGESGSGKSTLLNILSGIDKAYSGSIQIKGQIISRYDDNYIKNYVSFCSNDFSLIESISIEDNFKILKSIFKYDEDYLQSLIKTMNLDIDFKQSINEISGGQKQRLLILKSFLEDKPIMIFDEPTASLDNDNKKIIWDLLKKESMKKLIIVATHDDVNESNVINIIGGKIQNEFKETNLNNNDFSIKTHRSININEDIYPNKNNIISRIILLLNILLFSLIFAFSIKANEDRSNIYDKDELLLYENSNDSLNGLIEAYDDGIIDYAYLGFVDYKAGFTYSKNSIENYCYDEKIATCEKELCKDYKLVCGEDISNQYVVGKKLADELIDTCDNKLSYSDLIGLPISGSKICGISEKNTMCLYMDRLVYSENSLPVINNYNQNGFAQYEDYRIVYGEDVSDGKYIVNASLYDGMNYEDIMEAQHNSNCVGVFEFNGEYKNKFDVLRSDYYYQNFDGNIDYLLYDDSVKIVSGTSPNDTKEIVMSCYSGYSVGDVLFDYTVVGLYNSDSLDDYIYFTEDGLQRYKDISCILYAVYSNGYMAMRSDEIRYMISNFNNKEKDLYDLGFTFSSNYRLYENDSTNNNQINNYNIVITSFVIVIIIIIAVYNIISSLYNKKTLGVLLANGNNRFKVFLNYLYNNKLLPFIENIIALLLITIFYFVIANKYSVLNLGSQVMKVLFIIIGISISEMLISIIPLVVIINKNIISLIKAKNTEDNA